MYAKIGYSGGNSLLAGLAIVIGIPFPVWIWFKGEGIRKMSVGFLAFDVRLLSPVLSLDHPIYCRAYNRICLIFLLPEGFYLLTAIIILLPIMTEGYSWVI
jgi:hypothetical protein